VQRSFIILAPESGSLYFLRIFSIASEVGAKPSHLMALLQKMLLKIKGRFVHVKNQEEYVCL
jgi:hypothetical protein